MYKTMLVTASEKTEKKFRNLKCWGVNMGFSLDAVSSSCENVIAELKNTVYHLIIIDTDILKNIGMAWVHQIQENSLCFSIVLYSESPDFYFSRQAILSGLSDYITDPLGDEAVISSLNRIRDRVYRSVISQQVLLKEVEQFIDEKKKGFASYIFRILDDIYIYSNNLPEADRRAFCLYKTVIRRLYENNEWISIYIDKDPLLNIDRSIYHQSEYSKKLNDFFQEVYILYPHADDENVIQIIEYVLAHPDEDLRLVTLTEKLFLSDSHMSTVFKANTGIHYVDYVTNVKLARAKKLMGKKGVWVATIAEQLGYRDSAYFSRLFKKRYKMTPSDYRQYCNVADFDMAAGEISF